MYKGKPELHAFFFIDTSYCKTVMNTLESITIIEGLNETLNPSNNYQDTDQHGVEVYDDGKKRR